MFNERLDLATALTATELAVYETLLEGSGLAELIGLFVVKFGHIELQIDWMLAELKDEKNFETYKATKPGAPVGLKLAEIVRVMSQRAVTFTPDLADRFDHLQNALTPLRNELVHSMLGARHGKVACGHIGAVWNTTGELVRKNDLWPVAWTPGQILEATVWIDSMVAVLGAATLEIQKLPDSTGGVISSASKLAITTTIPEIPKRTMRTWPAWT